MDMEDGDPVGLLSGSEERNVEKLVISQEGDLVGKVQFHMLNIFLLSFFL